MADEDLLKLVRRDIGNLLFHFTSSNDKAEGKKCHEVLQQILSDGKLIATDDNAKSWKGCICFTEAPISEFVAYFSLKKIKPELIRGKKYEPYGIAVKKDWLYKYGGRPVLYDDKKTLALLPDDLRFKHVLYEPPSEDTTWEREWRILIPELVLDPSQTLVIVPTADIAFNIGYSHAEYREIPTSNMVPLGRLDGTLASTTVSPEVSTGSKIGYTTKWLAVSLDLFGFNL